MITRMEVVANLRRLVDETPEHLFVGRSMGKGLYECGTVGCLLRRSSMDPWFRKNLGTGDLFGTVFRRARSAGFGRMVLEEKVAEVFSLGIGDVRHLFGFDQPTHFEVTKGMVLANLDRILTGVAAVTYGGLVS